MKDVALEFYRGDTFTMDVVLIGWELPVDKMYFTVKERPNDKRATLQKGIDNGITFVDETEEEKTFNISICCTDTDNMKAEYEYVFDIELHSTMEDGAVIKKTIVTGTLNLLPSSTRTCNEC